MELSMQPAFRFYSLFLFLSLFLFVYLCFLLSVHTSGAEPLRSFFHWPFLGVRWCELDHVQGEPEHHLDIHSRFGRGLFKEQQFINFKSAVQIQVENLDPQTLICNPRSTIYDLFTLQALWWAAWLSWASWARGRRPSPSWPSPTTSPMLWSSRNNLKLSDSQKIYFFEQRTMTVKTI